MIEEAVEESPLLTQEQRKILRSLLEHYEDVFAACLDDVGTANYKPFHIDIKPGSSMIKSKPYDLGIVMNEIVRRELQRYVHAGKLIPGNPICIAPVFVVCIPRGKGSQEIKKLQQCFSRIFNFDSTVSVTELADAIEQQCSIRMVCDFRKLNEITVKKHYPLPLLRSILQRYHGMKYISNVDFKSGYLHFAIDEECQKYFGIVTPWGVFQWLNLCFGPTNGPSDFQEFLDIICARLIDDVLTMGQEFVEALLILEALFARLRFYNVKINSGKCQFLMPSVDFLGHLLSSKGLQQLKKHKNSVNRFPIPSNTKEVRSFLGLVRFNEHFIPNMANLAEPLIQVITG
jgi:hypothetical protein